MFRRIGKEEFLNMCNERECLRRCHGKVAEKYGEILGREEGLEEAVMIMRNQVHRLRAGYRSLVEEEF